jgi:hypothetical protein
VPPWASAHGFRRTEVRRCTLRRPIFPLALLEERLLAGGFILGLPAALALARLVKSQLFGVSPADPLAMAGAAALIVLAAATAGLFPACRAARIDPVQALRHE